MKDAMERTMNEHSPASHGQPLVTATEDGRKHEMKVVHLGDNMDFWVHLSLYQSQRSIWFFLKV